jgi:outer membrane protein assembly factor BamB
LALTASVTTSASGASTRSGPASTLAIRVSTAAGHTVFGGSWPQYHHDGLGSGADPTGTDLSPASHAWTSATLDADIFGEPVLASGRVIAATENDTVYELAANTGAVMWATHVGTPVPQGLIPGGGDIGPNVGITGTPVIDQARGEVFAVTDELVGGTNAQHFLTGLDLYTGAVLLHQAISLGSADQLAQLQRTGLTLADGNVIMGFGGNDGDAGNYFGWVIGIPEGGGGQLSFQVASSPPGNPGDGKGAVWMGGAAPIVDGSGNIWVATGNSTSVTSGDRYDYSDGVIELSPSLTVEQYFAPTGWTGDNAGDADLGSSNPAVLPNGVVFQAGKSQTAYVLNQAGLGGIGAGTAFGGYCGNDVDGGNAFLNATVYVPCMNGVIADATAPGHLAQRWTSPLSSGPPIVAGGLVWTINHSTSTLYGLDMNTGVEVEHFSLGSEANHFPTPSVADGLLLAPSAHQVHAFAGPAGLPPPPPPPPPRPGYWTGAADGGVFAFGGATFYGSMGSVSLAAAVVGMAATADGGGYWMVASDGGIFAFGDAGFSGSMGGRPLARPMVGMAPVPNGDGYWTVASDGGVFAFGGAPFLGSMGGRALAAPVVGMAATADGGGYWLVAADGGVFAFGDAAFHGSMGGQHLNSPVVGIARAPGGGYWLVAGDGGLFAFGGAGFFGSMGGRTLARPVVGLTPTSTGQGYWEVATDGGIFAFGDAPFQGSMGGVALHAPMVAVAAPPFP